MDGSQNLCQASTGQEDDWKILYETAFPADERMPVEDLRKLIGSGTVLLHKTTNKQGELLCFSVVNLMSNFGLLAYIATDSTKRSTGVGSKHMKHLIDLLKKQHGSYVGLFLEIESTKEAGLDTETQKARNRRLAFYQRLGAKRLHKKYLMPSYTAGGPPRQGELLWVELGATCVQESQVKPIIEEIFHKAYNLPINDPLIVQITSQFPTPAPTDGATCVVVEHPPANASSGSSASTASNTSPGSTAPADAKPQDTAVDAPKPETDTKPAADNAAVEPKPADAVPVTQPVETAAVQSIPPADKAAEEKKTTTAPEEEVPVKKPVDGDGVKPAAKANKTKSDQTTPAGGNTPEVPSK